MAKPELKLPFLHYVVHTPEASPLRPVQTLRTPIDTLHRLDFYATRHHAGDREPRSEHDQVVDLIAANWEETISNMLAMLVGENLENPFRHVEPSVYREVALWRAVREGSSIRGRLITQTDILGWDRFGNVYVIEVGVRSSKQKRIQIDESCRHLHKLFPTLSLHGVIFGYGNKTRQKNISFEYPVLRG
ncbi:MAG: hypothetical protein UZ21_OP11001001040 [Microgenomates bacterium OLB22]|nr:MAG: hypothetical protein UZ21_OP11001001040 [Microgenomates bacterium OLB22]